MSERSSSVSPSSMSTSSSPPLTPGMISASSIQILPTDNFETCQAKFNLLKRECSKKNQTIANLQSRVMQLNRLLDDHTIRASFQRKRASSPQLMSSSLLANTLSTNQPLRINTNNHNHSVPITLQRGNSLSIVANGKVIPINGLESAAQTGIADMTNGLPISSSTSIGGNNSSFRVIGPPQNIGQNFSGQGRSFVASSSFQAQLQQSRALHIAALSDDEAIRGTSSQTTVMPSSSIQNSSSSSALLSSQLVPATSTLVNATSTQPVTETTQSIGEAPKTLADEDYYISDSNTNTNMTAFEYSQSNFDRTSSSALGGPNNCSTSASVGVSASATASAINCNDNGNISNAYTGSISNTTSGRMSREPHVTYVNEAVARRIESLRAASSNDVKTNRPLFAVVTGEATASPTTLTAKELKVQKTAEEAKQQEEADKQAVVEVTSDLSDAKTMHSLLIRHLTIRDVDAFTAGFDISKKILSAWRSRCISKNKMVILSQEVKGKTAKSSQINIDSRIGPLYLTDFSLAQRVLRSLGKVRKLLYRDSRILVLGVLTACVIEIIVGLEALHTDYLVDRCMDSTSAYSLSQESYCPPPEISEGRVRIEEGILDAARRFAWGCTHPSLTEEDHASLCGPSRVDSLTSINGESQKFIHVLSVIGFFKAHYSQEQYSVGKVGENVMLSVNKNDKTNANLTRILQALDSEFVSLNSPTNSTPATVVSDQNEDWMSNAKKGLKIKSDTTSVLTASGHLSTETTHSDKDGNHRSTSANLTDKPLGPFHERGPSPAFGASSSNAGSKVGPGNQGSLSALLAQQPKLKQGVSRNRISRANVRQVNTSTNLRRATSRVTEGLLKLKTDEPVVDASTRTNPHSIKLPAFKPQLSNINISTATQGSSSSILKRKIDCTQSSSLPSSHAALDVSGVSELKKPKPTYQSSGICSAMNKENVSVFGSSSASIINKSRGRSDSFDEELHAKPSSTSATASQQKGTVSSTTTTNTTATSSLNQTLVFLSPYRAGSDGVSEAGSGINPREIPDTPYNERGK